jgi:prepilin-type N-terminal cleavage/methylation domain-containing protein
MYRHSPNRDFSSGFTLIELLVVIAIIAILAVVVILVLNPAELLRQSRDSSRLSDMATLTSALAIFATNNTSAGGLGSASTTYISIADATATSTVGDQCQGLGFSGLPTGDSYFCPASTTARVTSGTGWIPVNFSTLPSGSPLGNLPVDPSNTTSTGLFYTYTTDGSANYEVTALMESSKYKNQFNLNPTTVFFPGLVAKGNNLSLSELYSPVGLVGYWPLDEGSGTQAIDLSGNGNTGSWSGSTPYYTGGKIGAYGGNFNGINDYVNLGTSSLFNSANITLSAWINTNNSASTEDITAKELQFKYRVSAAHFEYLISCNGLSWNITTGNISNVQNNTWYYTAMTVNSLTQSVLFYVNGQLANSSSLPCSISTYNSNTMDIGSYDSGAELFSGVIDDVRIYNRALSAAEIQAMYISQK